MTTASEEPLPQEERHLLDRKQKVSHVLARQILNDVLLRDYRPGDSLGGEAELLQRYKVGRGSLREALRLLEVHGLIYIRPGPGGGPVLSSVDSRDFGRMAALFFQYNGAVLGELIHARLVVEPLLAAMAASNRDPVEIKGLVDIMSRATSNPIDDDALWVRESHAFHNYIAHLAGNRVLELFANSLKEIFSERIKGKPLTLDERREVLDAHHRIAQAIEQGDGATAEREMRDHMTQVASHSSESHAGLLDEIIQWR